MGMDSGHQHGKRSCPTEKSNKMSSRTYITKAAVTNISNNLILLLYEPLNIKNIQVPLGVLISKRGLAFWEVTSAIFKF